MHVGESSLRAPRSSADALRSAREIIGDEMGVPAYKPAMDAEDVAANVSNSVSTGYRRARAGEVVAALSCEPSRCRC